MSSEKDVLGENRVKVAVMLERAGMALEDGEWDKAIQLCEEVLNLDPKNAQAYLDEALAQAQCSSLCDFFEKRLQETERVSSEAFSVKADKEHVTAMVTKYSIPAYVSAEAIESLYVFSYSSCVAGRKEQYQKEEESWNNHKLFARAEKFAEGTAKEGIVQEKKAFFDALQKRIQEAQVKEAEEKMQVETSKDTLVKEADNKAKAMYEQGMVTKQLSLRAKKKKRTIIVAAAGVLALVFVLLVVVPAIKGPRVGEHVFFGTYPQTASGTDNTPIEWIVLARKGNKVLLLSWYGMDAMPYNTKMTDVTWEKCTLRTWMNGTFYNKAFTATEKKAIETTTVSNAKEQGSWGIYGGNDTEDKVFLLSYAEANKYLGVKGGNINNTKAQVHPTEYAITQGATAFSDYKTADGLSATNWWLRTPGHWECSAESVEPSGSLIFIDFNPKWYYPCVRPAIWVDLSVVSFD